MAKLRVSLGLNTGPKGGQSQCVAVVEATGQALLTAATNKLRLKKKDVNKAQLYVWKTGAAIDVASLDVRSIVSDGDLVVVALGGESFAGKASTSPTTAADGISSTSKSVESSEAGAIAAVAKTAVRVNDQSAESQPKSCGGGSSSDKLTVSNGNVSSTFRQSKKETSSQGTAFRLGNGDTVYYFPIAPNEVDVSRGERLLTLQLFAPAVCKQLIDLAATFDDWATLTDSVDRQPEQQHNIYDFAKGTNDGVLYPFCAQVSSDVLAPALEKHFGLSGLKLHWAFLRKYTMDGRIDFPVHRDSSAATANILLSDPKDFTGAELYLLPNEHKGADFWSPKEFKKKLPEIVLRRSYAVPYKQGQCCMHLGKRLHGVLPLTSGSRYTLILMYLP